MHDQNTPSESVTNEKKRTTRKEKLLAKRAEILDKRMTEVKQISEQIKAIEKAEKKKQKRKHVKAFQTVGKMLADSYSIEQWENLRKRAQIQHENKKITAAELAAVIALVDDKISQ